MSEDSDSFSREEKPVFRPYTRYLVVFLIYIFNEIDRKDQFYTNQLHFYLLLHVFFYSIKLRIYQFLHFLRIFFALNFSCLFLQRKPSPGGCSDRRGECQEEGAGEEEGAGGGKHEAVVDVVVVDNPP